MKKSIALIVLTMVLAISVSACGGSAEPPAPEPTDVIVEESVKEEPAAPEPTDAPAADVDPESPAGKLAAALEGKDPNVELFFEGIPTPADATPSILEEYRVEFITELDVAGATQWYRDTFTSLNLIEVDGLGFESENSATTYWAGYPDGRAIKVFVRRLSSATSEVKVTFEEL